MATAKHASLQTIHQNVLHLSWEIEEAECNKLVLKAFEQEEKKCLDMAELDYGFFKKLVVDWNLPTLSQDIEYLAAWVRSTPISTALSPASTRPTPISTALPPASTRSTPASTALPPASTRSTSASTALSPTSIRLTPAPTKSTSTSTLPPAPVPPAPVPPAPAQASTYAGAYALLQGEGAPPSSQLNMGSRHMFQRGATHLITLAPYHLGENICGERMQGVIQMKNHISDTGRHQHQARLPPTPNLPSASLPSASNVPTGPILLIVPLTANDMQV
ncbi:hypothetical protein DFH29DRAFT_1002923 [Suillus ampliporus]|nr:hypothetical protein DFH29DRAFT_1002923 [Suillus ampliporus]